MLRASAAARFPLLPDRLSDDYFCGVGALLAAFLRSGCSFTSPPSCAPAAPEPAGASDSASSSSAASDSTTRAPLRLRCENELGFKMVKWVAAIEFVHDFADIGASEGGYNEDHEFYGYRVPI